jgi:hypothetical protein
MPKDENAIVFNFVSLSPQPLRGLIEGSMGARFVFTYRESEDRLVRPGQIRSKLNPESNGDKTEQENDKCRLSC